MLFWNNDDFNRWIALSNVLIILTDFNNYDNRELVESLKRNNNCTDASESLVERFVNHKPSLFKCIIYNNMSVTKSIIIEKEKINYMPIMLTTGKSLRKSLNIGIPTFVGWFWNNFDQDNLHQIAQDCLKQLISLKKLKEQLNNILHSNNLEKYWIKQKKRLHVTAMFIGGKETDNSKQFLNNVSKMFHTTESVKVTGFLLTPRTFSGHIELKEDAKWMFNPKEQELFKLLPHVTVGVAPGISPVQSGIDQVPVQRMIENFKLPNETFRIKHGLVQDWGDCQFYVVLHKPITYEVMFLPKY